VLTHPDRLKVLAEDVVKVVGHLLAIWRGVWNSV
jgi:hypothetical protein